MVLLCSSMQILDCFQLCSFLTEEYFDLFMQFDALVAALPLSSEEDQLKRIQELQVDIRQSD